MRCFFSCFLLVGFASPVEAQATAATLDDIREFILYARYEDAIAAAEAMLGREDQTAAMRNETLEVLATAHIANDDGLADAVLDELFSRDPGYRLADHEASPRVQGAFALARRRAPPPISVLLRHEPPHPTNYESPRIDVSIENGASAVQELRLIHRRRGEVAYHHIVMTLTGSSAVEQIPLGGDGETPEEIEYYLIALAPSQTPLGGLGSAGTPIQVTVPPRIDLAPTPPVEDGSDEPERPRRWWIWTIVAATVAGGATAGYFLARPDAPRGSLGAITLQ